MGPDGIYWTIGGILDLFRALVAQGLMYMNSHNERLQARLTESEEAKVKFLEMASALEAEMSRLLEQVEHLPKQLDEEE